MAVTIVAGQPQTFGLVAGYSQEALANEIGVASGTPAKWEQGLTRPQARQPPALACALGTTLEGATAP
jgi:transcriptional regulator with XRE-family HTH domain